MSIRCKINIGIPPVKGGITDYDEILASRLCTNSRVFNICESDFSDIIKEVDIFFLQYSGYGYQKRGTPLWLLKEIDLIPTGLSVFGVFFHELYAIGFPWKSSFWLSPIQRIIAKKIAERADFWVTNREKSADWLMQYAGNKPHAVLPVYSNVGEPICYTEDRNLIAVVFGSPKVREAAYKFNGGEIFEWAKRNNMSVHDIGPQLLIDKLKLI
ncbi:MAG: hypothetical protein IPP59_17260 [Betaproteobacteria bacterium]|nr:hypothetical protein [Candidatus Dechloromonas phosphorivorans]